MLLIILSGAVYKNKNPILAKNLNLILSLNQTDFSQQTIKILHFYFANGRENKGGDSNRDKKFF